MAHSLPISSSSLPFLGVNLTFFPMRLTLFSFLLRVLIKGPLLLIPGPGVLDFFLFSESFALCLGSNEGPPLAIPDSQNTYWEEHAIDVIYQWGQVPTEQPNGHPMVNQEFHDDQEVDQPHPAIARMEYDSTEYKDISRLSRLCEKWQEKIFQRVRNGLPQQGILIEDEIDIKRALSMFFFESEEREPKQRLSFLRRTYSSLENPNSPKWLPIIREIENLLNN